MFFSGLKTRITGTLTFLMILGVLLGNFVAAVFWQKAMIRSEYKHSLSVLDTVLSTMEGKPVKDEQAAMTLLNRTCEYIGEQCHSVFYYDGISLYGNSSSFLQQEIEDMAVDTFHTNIKNYRLNGRTWGVFTPANRYLLISNRGNTQSTLVLVAELSLDSIYDSMREDQKIIFVYLFVNVLFLVIIGMFRFIKITISPLERMIKVTNEHHEDGEVLFGGVEEQSEFGRLNLALNSMLMRIESEKSKLRKTIASLEDANREIIRANKEVVLAEKLASVGRLSAGLAHEIGNPVSIVQGYIELLQEPEIDLEDRAQYSQRALDELERVNRLIKQLLDYARISYHEKAEIRIDETLFEDLIGMVRIEQEKGEISIETFFEKDLFVRVDREALRQVLLNCLLNAIDAIHEKEEKDIPGEITITASRQSADIGEEANKIKILIKDNGLGLKNGALEKVFEPFYTTKAVGSGTGLGLYVSHTIIEAFRGRIWLQSNEGCGVTVGIVLPIADDAVIDE